MRTPISAPPRIVPLGEMLDIILDASRAADAAEADLAHAEAAYAQETTPENRRRLQEASRVALESEIRFEVTWQEMVRTEGRGRASSPRPFPARPRDP